MSMIFLVLIFFIQQLQQAWVVHVDVDTCIYVYIDLLIYITLYTIVLYTFMRKIGYTYLPIHRKQMNIWQHKVQCNYSYTCCDNVSNVKQGTSQSYKCLPIQNLIQILAIRCEVRYTIITLILFSDYQHDALIMHSLPLFVHLSFF